MYVSEDRSIKESYGSESFKEAIESSKYLITTLRPYIQTETTTQNSCHSLKACKKEGDEDVGVGELKLNR